MAFCIVLNDLKCEFQVEESWAGLAHDFFGPALAGPGRRCVRRRHVPSDGLYEKRQTIPPAALTNSRRTDRIRHRNFASLSTSRKRRAQWEREGRLSQRNTSRWRMA